MFRSKPDVTTRRKRQEFIPNFRLEWFDDGWIVREMDVFGCCGVIVNEGENYFWSYEGVAAKVFSKREHAIRAVYHIAAEEHIKEMKERTEGYEYD